MRGRRREAFVPGLLRARRRRRIAARGWTALALVGAISWAVEPLGAQSFRGWAGTSVQLVEIRPFGVDTVPRSEVVTDEDGRDLYGGIEVSCVLADFCTGFLPLDERRAVAATQDLSLVFWGLGLQGLSVTTMLRARSDLGSDAIWPRSDDAFDALLAYAQLQRGPIRVRAGRQEIRSGLGFSAFDGVSASIDRSSFGAEAFGGRSLARGLREPANEALKGLDDFFIDHGVFVLGASATARWFRTRMTARYQREILADRSGLASERASFDASTATPALRVTGSFDYDFSFQRVGKAHVTLSAPLAEGRWLAELTGRRYVPYFDLSTIWGFFEPVEYSELVARVGWAPSTSWSVRLSGGWRSYGETNTVVVLRPLTDTGWRAEARSSWAPSEPWTVTAAYELEWGPGGFLSSADAGVRFAPTDRLGASISLMSFQQIEEYRLGDGRAFGVGGSADYRFGEALSLAAGASLIRHRDGGSVFTSPWNQARAWTSLRVQIGRDPGLRSGDG